MENNPETPKTTDPQADLCRDFIPSEAHRGPCDGNEGRVMLEVGVEGDLFNPHVWNADCEKSGCVRAQEPVAKKPATLAGAIGFALYALRNAEQAMTNYGGHQFSELYRVAADRLSTFSLDNLVKEYVTIDMVIALLNEALAADPEAITRLVSIRVHCNEQLLNHPTIQVSGLKVGDKVVNAETGFLGLLNGIFGARKDGWGFIVAQFDKPGGPVVKFTRASLDPEHPEHPAFVRCG